MLILCTARGIQQGNACGGVSESFIAQAGPCSLLRLSIASKMSHRQGNGFAGVVQAYQMEGKHNGNVHSTTLSLAKCLCEVDTLRALLGETEAGS